MVFYMAFVLCLTVYVISSGTFHYDKRRKLFRNNLTQNCSQPNDSLCKNPTAFSQFIVEHEEIVHVSRGLFAALAVLELIRKICGCSGYASIREYVRHLDNVLEWVVSMSAFVLVGSSFDSDHLTHEGECFQEHLGAVTLLLAYFMLMRMVGLLPLFKCYVAMYTSVLLLFVRVLASYLCLLLGFVLAFCAAFPGLAEFADPAMGAVRTFGMMSGEILFQNTFLENQKGGLTVTSQLLFFVFVLFITVVLMNLLVGLAVNDIQGLQATADLLQLQQQTRLVSRTERALLGARLPARLRDALLRRATLSPGRYRKVFHVRPLSQRERRLPPHLLAAVYALARQPSAVAAFDGRRKGSDVAALVPTLSLPAQGGAAAAATASAAALEQLTTEVAQLRKSLEAVLQILNARAAFVDDISEIA